MKQWDSFLSGLITGVALGIVGGIILFFVLLIFVNRKKHLLKIVSELEKEGVITESQGNMILEKAGISKPQTSVARADFLSKFITFLVFVASVAISFGVVLFFASNWAVLNKLFKVSLTLSVSVITNLAGFYLIYANYHNVLGKGMLFIANIVFGVTIYLLAQIYNITTPHSYTFLMWGIVSFLYYYLYKIKPSLLLGVIFTVVFYTKETYFYAKELSLYFIPLSLYLIGLVSINLFNIHYKKDGMNFSTYIYLILFLLMNICVLFLMGVVDTKIYYRIIAYPNLILLLFPLLVFSIILFILSKIYGNIEFIDSIAKIFYTGIAYSIFQFFVPLIVKKIGESVGIYIYLIKFLLYWTIFTFSAYYMNILCRQVNIEWSFYIIKRIYVIIFAATLAVWHITFHTSSGICIDNALMSVPAIYLLIIYFYQMIEKAKLTITSVLNDIVGANIIATIMTEIFVYIRINTEGYSYDLKEFILYIGPVMIILFTYGVMIFKKKIEKPRWDSRFVVIPVIISILYTEVPQLATMRVAKHILPFIFVSIIVTFGFINRNTKILNISSVLIFLIISIRFLSKIVPMLSAGIGLIIGGTVVFALVFFLTK